MLLVIAKVATLIIIINGMHVFASTTGVQEFLVDNGQYNVDLFYNSSRWHAISFRNIFVARVPMDNIEMAHKHSFGIFVYNSPKDDLLSYLTAITKRPVKKSLLVIFEPWDDEKINLIKKHLAGLQATAFFYIAISTNNTIGFSWYQIISIQSGTAITSLKFARNTTRIMETFDLQGLQITSTSLTWAPYLTIDDCDEDGLNCAKNYGFMMDIMDNLAIRFNFTFLSQKNVDNKWYELGTDGRYTGVWGDILSNNFDMSLSPWSWILSRDVLFDFVPFTKYKYILAFSPKQLKIDFSLFTRAFQGDTWISLLSTAFALLIIILLANNCGFIEMLNGMKMVTFLWWLFFTLVHSYYCGVLTMFFAVQAAVPFETVSDALQAYPEWNLMFSDGAKQWVHDMAQLGDHDYITLWQRYEDNPTETTYSSIEHGLQLIRNGHNVIRISRNMLLGHLKSNPIKQNIHWISTGKEKFSHILLHKNSPLVSMLNQGASYFRESGIERELFNKCFGDVEKQIGSTTSEGNILNLGQMVTVFIAMLSVFVIALVVLCGEVTFKRGSIRPTKQAH